MLNLKAIDKVLELALEEDAPWGDITSNYLISADATAHAKLVAREPGVFSGGQVFARSFELTLSLIHI